MVWTYDIASLSRHVNAQTGRFQAFWDRFPQESVFGL